MDFELDDEQVQLQRAVRDVVAHECPPALLRSVLAGDDDADALWKTFVGLDWPLLTLPVEDGGVGASAVELAIALDELGYVADPTPFLATTTQYLPLVRECATRAQRRPLLDAVRSGGTGAVVFDAPERRGADGSDAIRARSDGDGWVLHGEAHAVLDADRADEIAVVAAADAAPGVFVVPGGAVSAARTPSFDGTLHLATVRLDGVRVGPDRSLVGTHVAAGIEQAHQEAVAGMAAMMVGACQRILDLVVTHVKERRQFNVPIGSFQAVKHLAVDLHVAIERARVLHQFAALTIVENDDRRVVAPSMAKAAAGDCQRLAIQHGIQLFGGLGFTWENDLQLFVRRAKAGELLLGTSAEHRARVARWALAGAASEEMPV